MVAGVLLATGCGNTSDVEVKPVSTIDPASDKIAFLAAGSDMVMVMAADGSNVQNAEFANGARPIWPDKERIILRACSTTDDVDIEVITPGGFSLGPLDDSNWTPEISPVEPFVLIACAQVDGDKVLLVSDIEVEGSREGWSRSGRANLSDQIEVRAVAMDGSEIREVTSNQAGDWLPRWSPDGTMVAVESNRDGNSEIYVVRVLPRRVERLTDSASPDLAPVWSRDGNFVAFMHREIDQQAVWTVEPNSNDAQPTGQYGKPVPWSR